MLVPRSVERSAMRGRVDAPGRAADDAGSGAAETGPDAHGHLVPRRRCSCARRPPTPDRARSGERTARDEERDGRIVLELEELGQVLVVDRGDEPRAEPGGLALDRAGVEGTRPDLIGLAAGGAAADRGQAGLGRSLAPGELVQLIRLDAPQRRQDEQRLPGGRATRVAVGEPRRDVERATRHVGAPHAAHLSRHGRAPRGRRRRGRTGPRPRGRSRRRRPRRGRRSCARP